MFRTRLFRSACLLCSVLVCTTAHAELRAYEGFNYYVPTSGVLPNVRSGTSIDGLGLDGSDLGFSTTYEDSGYAPGVVYYIGANPEAPEPEDPGFSSSMKYHVAVNATAAMEPIGNHYYAGYWVNGHPRDLALPFGDSRGPSTNYISFLVQKWRDNYYGGIYFGQAWFGWGGGSKNWIMSHDAGATPTYPNGEHYWNPWPKQSNMWIVGEFIFDGDTNNDTVNMYLNPDATQPLPVPAYGTYTNVNVGDIGSLALQWGRDHRVDEIRIADSWTDLVQSDPADQGVTRVTADETTDIRTGFGYALRLEATADATLNNPVGGLGIIADGDQLSYDCHIVNHGDNQQKGIWRFDLDDQGLRTGALILEAKVVLSPFHYVGSTAVTNSYAYRITSDWDETTGATVSVDMASIVGTDGAWGQGLHIFDITGLAQEWVDGTKPDYGICTVFASDSARRQLFSREHMPILTDETGGNPDWGYGYWGIERPLLLVNYFEPAFGTIIILR